MDRRIVFIGLCAAMAGTAPGFTGRFLELTSPTLSKPPGMGAYGLWLKNDGGTPKIWAVDGTGSRHILSGSGVSDHGALGGLGDDDHAQYLNAARHAGSHNATFNDALEIAGDANGKTTLGAHVADAEMHWKRPARTLTVAKDGTGQYSTIAEAVGEANARAGSLSPYLVEVHPGVYEEDKITVNGYVSIMATVPLQSIVDSADGDPVFILTGNNCLAGLWIRNGRDGDVVQINSSVGATTRLWNCALESEMDSDNAGAYALKETASGVGGYVRAANCAFYASGASGLIYRDSGHSGLDWEFRSCEFQWHAAHSTAERAIYMPEATAASFDSCAFLFQGAPAIASRQSGLYLASPAAGAKAWVSNCRFVLSGTNGQELRALETGGLITVFARGCQFYWANESGAQRDLYAGPGSTIRTASCAWDSQSKEGGEGAILDLTEGDATFNTLTVNTALVGAGITAGAFGDYFWPLGTYKRDSEAKALKALSVSANNPTTCNYATTDTAGNAYVQRDLEVDRYAYLPTIKSGTGETVMTTSGDDATFADTATVTNWLWAKTYGLFGPGTRAGTALLEINGNAGSATALDLRNLGTATEGIDFTNSGLASGDKLIKFNANDSINYDGSILRISAGKVNCSSSAGAYMDGFTPFNTTNLFFAMRSDSYAFQFRDSASNTVLQISATGDVVQGASADTAESWNPRAGGAATLTFGGAGEGDAFRFNGNNYPNRALLSSNDVATTAVDWLDASRCVAAGAAPAVFSASPGMAYDLALDVSVDGAVYRLPCEWRYEAVTGVRFAALYTGAVGHATITAYLKEFDPAAGTKTTVRTATTDDLAAEPTWTNAEADFATYSLLTGKDYYVVFKCDGLEVGERVFIQSVGIEFTKGS